MVIDNRLDIKKQPMHRVLNDLFTQKMSGETRKHRTKVLALSVGILYLQFSNVELVQLAFIKFTSTSSSPMPLLIAALAYFFFYFAVGSILDYRKFIISKRFDVWDQFASGFSFIKDKMKSKEYIEKTQTQEHISQWLINVDAEYISAIKIRRLELAFYWGFECALPSLLSFAVVLKLFNFI